MTKARPNFKIVEGGSLVERNEIYEDFKLDYMSPNITVAQMLKKYDLSKNQYYHLKNRVAEETGINHKISKQKFVRKFTHYTRNIDYQKSTGKYRVSKVTMGKKKHFGVYDDLDTAVYVRDKLEANHWTDQAYKELRFELFGEEDQYEKIDRIYDDFKKDFVKGESTKFLTRKYHIGQTLYKTLSQMVRSETGLTRKPQLPLDEMRRNERNLYRLQNKGAI